MEELTKETQKLICLVYKEYSDRRKNGSDRNNAVFFRFNFADDILNFQSTVLMTLIHA